MPTFDLKTTGKDMQGSLEHTLRDFATLRVGMASANFLDTVSVEAYGQFMPIKQTATISVADNFTLIVAPFDKGNIKAIIPKIIISIDLDFSVKKLIFYLLLFLFNLLL